MCDYKTFEMFTFAAKFAQSQFDKLVNIACYSDGTWRVVAFESLGIFCNRKHVPKGFCLISWGFPKLVNVVEDWRISAVVSFAWKTLLKLIFIQLHLQDVSSDPKSVVSCKITLDKIQFFTLKTPFLSLIKQYQSKFLKMKNDHKILISSLMTFVDRKTFIILAAAIVWSVRPTCVRHHIRYIFIRNPQERMQVWTISCGKYIAETGFWLIDGKSSKEPQLEYGLSGTDSSIVSIFFLSWIILIWYITFWCMWRHTFIASSPDIVTINGG